MAFRGKFNLLLLAPSRSVLAVCPCYTVELSGFIEVNGDAVRDSTFLLWAGIYKIDIRFFLFIFVVENSYN